MQISPLILTTERKMTTAEKIRLARKNVGFTQKDLGERLGVSAAMIAQYENGSRSPKIETLHRLATALGVCVSDLTPDLSAVYPEEVEAKMPDLPSDEKKILNLYRRLNNTGKAEALKRIEDLTFNPKYQNE